MINKVVIISAAVFAFLCVSMIWVYEPAEQVNAPQVVSASSTNDSLVLPQPEATSEAKEENPITPLTAFVVIILLIFALKLVNEHMTHKALSEMD